MCGPFFALFLRRIAENIDASVSCIPRVGFFRMGGWFTWHKTRIYANVSASSRKQANSMIIACHKRAKQLFQK